MKSKKILLCVTGGIAVYKVCTLVNLFLKEGADVRVIMTSAATQFVTPLTFQALTNHAVYFDMFKLVNYEEIEHITLAKWADICIIAPATANTIGKIANGIADNILTTVIMALPQKTKVIIAPAMNVEMWNNPIVKKNVDSLKKMSNKYIFINPIEGILACRDEGIGKISDNKDIIECVKKVI